MREKDLEVHAKILGNKSIEKQREKGNHKRWFI